LFAATLIALIWANSPFGYLYESLWNYKFGISTTYKLEIIKPLILWVNDGLMALFFFLIGLEIKRELLIGELNSVRKAISPLIAAIGAMIIPVSIYLLANPGPETTRGWGIPMATDIAFSLAILQLLGRRVPLSLKVFLTAFAIVDDLGAVMIIALFYSGTINWSLLFYAFLILGFLFYLSYRQYYSKYVLLIAGIVVWVLFLKSGIHPTIAGILLALSVPIRQKLDIQTYAQELSNIVDKLQTSGDAKKFILTEKQIYYIDNLEDWTTRVQSTLQRLEHQLHGWVAYVIIPIFAFANAGVSFGGEVDLNFPLIIAIGLGLIAGKSLGVTLFSWLSVKLGWAEFPEGVRFRQIIGVAFLAGVGFTMSIFVANLAFADNPILLDSAKVGILIGSLISGLIGYLILRSSGQLYLSEE